MQGFLVGKNNKYTTTCLSLCQNGGRGRSSSRSTQNLLWKIWRYSWRRVHTCLHNLILSKHVRTYTPHMCACVLRGKKITCKLYYTGCSVSNITHACTHVPPVHTGLCAAVLVSSMDSTEEILPSQFPGTELGVTWLADAQPRWKECNSTPPTPSRSQPLNPLIHPEQCGPSCVRTDRETYSTVGWEEQLLYPQLVEKHSLIFPPMWNNHRPAVM